MKQKQHIQKILRTVYVSLCALAIFLTACQPTPEVPPLANRAGGLPKDAIIDAVSDGEIKEIDAPAHWTEHMERRDGRITIDADVDVHFPETSNTPILELAQTELTQERLTELVRYFAGNKQLLKKSALMTKSDLEKMLEQMDNKQGTFSLPGRENFNVGERDRLLEKIEEAPDEIIWEPVEIGFSYPLENPLDDIFGIETLQAENTFRCSFETKNGGQATIKATRYDPSVGSSSSFSYSSAIPGEFYDSILRETDENYLRFYASQDGTILELLEPVDDTWVQERTEWLAAVDMALERAHALSPEQAKAKLDILFDDLGIDHMQMEGCRKVLLFPEEAAGSLYSANPADTEICYEFTYYRKEAGMLASFYRDSDFYVSSEEEIPVTPPFYPEYIIAYVDRYGNIDFSWENMSHIVGGIAENTKLLPFDEIKERFADNLNYYTMPDGNAIITVNSVELRTAYTTAYGDPAHAWLVPVWVFDYTKQSEIDDGALMMNMLHAQFQINAIDGSFVALPLLSYSIG